MPDAIAAARDAFEALAAGRVTIPPRTRMPLANGAAILTMPGATGSPERVGAKFLSVVPDNADTRVPVIQGLVVLFDPIRGTPVAIIEGTALTAIRTGAASGLATDLLARRDARTLAMIGAGAQARDQVAAVRCVRSIEDVRIVSRTPARAQRVAAMLGEEVGVRVCRSVQEATRGADVICTATPSSAPLLCRRDVDKGVHINAIGSYRDTMHEVASDLLGAAAMVVVDSREAALDEAGEVVRAVAGGILTADDLVEIGDVVVGRRTLERRDEDITVFKSVGLAVQDLCAAGRLLERARSLSCGTVVPF